MFVWIVIGAGAALLFLLLLGIRIVHRRRSRTSFLESRIVEPGRGATQPAHYRNDYQVLFDNARDGLVLTASDGAVLDANPSAADFLGYSIDELKSTCIADWPIDPADREFMMGILSEGRPVNDHLLRIRTGDGQVRDCRLTAHPRTNGEGGHAGYQIILGETTDASLSAEVAAPEKDQYRLLVENVEDVLFVLDLNLHFSYVSPSVKILLGYDPSELIGQPMEPCLAPDSQNIASQLVEIEPETIIREAIPSRRAKTIMLEMRRKESTSIWTEVKATPILDRNGKAVGVAGVARDVSSQKQAEEALENAYYSLYQVLEFLPDATFVIDKQGYVTAWNRAVAELTGISAENIIGKGDYEYSLPFYGARRPALANIALEWVDQYADQYLSIKRREDGVLVSEAFHQILGDGVYIAATARVLQDSEGRPIGAIESLHNITEVKLAEKALRESERRWAQMIEFLPDATMVIDDNGILIAWNQAMEALTGVKASEIVGKGDYEYALPFYSYRRPVMIDMVIDFNEQISSQYEYIRREGDRLVSETFMSDFCGRGQTWLWNVAAPLYDENGRIVGAIESIRDITERKLAEETIKSQKERLEFILEGTNVGSWEWNVKTGETIFNERWAEIIGCTLKEILPTSVETWFKYVHPEDMKVSKAALEKHFRREADYYDVECRMRHKDGHWVWVLNRGKVTSWIDDEKPLWMYGTQQEITERKQAEEALKESEDRFRALSEESPFGISLIAQDGSYEYVNPSFSKLFGYTLQDLKTGRDWFNLAYPNEEYRKLAIKKWKEDIEGYPKGDGRLRIFDVTCMDGSLKTIIFRLVTTVSHGKIVFYEDITDRKKTEKALRESRQRMELAILGADLGTWDWDVTTGNVIVNERYAHMRGYQLGEISNNIHDWTRYVHPDDQARAQKNMSAHLGGRSELYEMEYRTTHKSGGWVWVLDRARVTERDKDGLALRVSGTHLDITERKLAEDALKESERKYRLLAENITDNIFVLTWPDLKYSYVSPSVQRILGYTAEEVMTLTLADIFTPESLKYTIDVLHEELSIESQGADPSRSYTLELEEYHKNGSKVWVESTISGLRSKEGQLIGILGSSRDITERREFQAQLQQAQKMEAIGTLAGGIAHDFNNLLQAINGYTQILLMKQSDKSPDHENLNAIQKLSDRAAKLVQQLLFFSRRAEIRKIPLDLNQEVKYIHSVLERIIPKMIDIELLLDGALWKINADPIQIEQALLNLGTNAADAMPGGGKLLISTENLVINKEPAQDIIEAKPGEYVALTVADTGQGIDQATAERIFEPFYTTKEIGKGTGLGLSSVYGVVKSHGGHITCHSEVGKGTTFKIYFPVIAQPDVEKTKEFKPKTLPRGSETILLVDDEESIRDIAQQVLEEFGYSVLAASNGEEALQIFSRQSREIHLVVLDIGMPGMGGHKCLQELLILDPEVRVIIASGYSINGQVKKSMEAGAKGYVGKPYQLADLLNTVRAVLDEEK